MMSWAGQHSEPHDADDDSIMALIISANIETGFHSVFHMLMD